MKHSVIASILLCCVLFLLPLLTLGPEVMEGEEEITTIEKLPPGEQDGQEGCLSVPGRWGMVKRPNYVRVQAQDRFGEWYEVEAEGLLARCILHENDHLDGHLYTEKVHKWMTEEEIAAMYEEEDEDE